MKKEGTLFLTDAQLREEIGKCEYCAEKPCQEGCPANCSPADFIMAAKGGRKGDYRRAAAVIMGHNPLGGVCGAVCPDRFCMKKCSHREFDASLEIPAIQATIIQKAKDLGVMPEFRKAKANGKKVAVVGAGPAGYAAAGVLAQKGYKVHLFERGKRAGGMAGLIPDFRLEKKVLKTDLDWLMDLGDITLKPGQDIVKPESLLRKGYDAVLVTTGLDTPFRLRIEGEAAAIDWLGFLSQPAKYRVAGKRVAVIGGGAVAADCAETASAGGAARVELFALETLHEMPLTRKEFEGLLGAGVQVNGRVSVTAIRSAKGKLERLSTVKVDLPKGKAFHPSLIRPVQGTESSRKDFDLVIVAVGARPSFKAEGRRGVFFAGDVVNGPKTVVEASAAGKNAAIEVDAFVSRRPKPVVHNNLKSHVVLQGRQLVPVPVAADFFGRRIRSPFLLSAAPPSDGYEQMKRAYDAGWAGGVMKTAFDGLSIHIPGEYMFAFDQSTYANCDNVSGHSLRRVCREVKRLIREYPDRLTMASTGGPVSGHDAKDRKGWQANTKLLEDSGVMGIEYSLSCPQGGDGTKGDIVSQDAELTAKIIDWVMQVGDPAVPKLFKLTGAVTSIFPILKAIAEVLGKYPKKKAGVTLANTFPTMAFRPGKKKTWDEGIVVGMSGEGVTPISYLTLANAARADIVVSGNGGPMDYKAAADFLALGANTVQFCTIVMKYGYGIIDDLESGLSHLMEERGLGSVKELIGCALPDPITGFMELTSTKKISAVRAELCEHCGNCTRCPYLAIELDENKVPKTDPSKCIGCSICAQKCFSSALYMRERTKAEFRALRED